MWFFCVGQLMVWTWEGVTRYSLQVGVPVTPWGLAFSYSNTAMTVLCGCLLLLFYCNAPFADGHTPFVVIRTGRRNWILDKWYISLKLRLCTWYSSGVHAADPVAQFVLFWRLGQCVEILAGYPENYDGHVYLSLWRWPNTAGLCMD